MPKTLCSAFRKLRKSENAVLKLPETQERRKRCAQLSGNSRRAKKPRSAFPGFGKVEKASLKLKNSPAKPSTHYLLSTNVKNLQGFLQQRRQHLLTFYAKIQPKPGGLDEITSN